jgi:hypothetical protein
VVRKYSVRFVNGRLQWLSRIEPCHWFCTSFGLSSAFFSTH